MLLQVLWEPRFVSREVTNALGSTRFGETDKGKRILSRKERGVLLGSWLALLIHNYMPLIGG